MAANADQPQPISGVRLAAAKAGFYRNRFDAALIELCPEAVSAGVFTKNQICAAPIVVAKKHLRRQSPRHFLINAGCANACTGSQGLRATQLSCRELANLTGLSADTVLPFSTGVIAQVLAADKLIAVMPALLDGLAEDNWLSAACAIMTTDTRAKHASRCFHCGDQVVRITGISKGAGMIHPNMATMLAFIACDIEAEKNELQALLEEACRHSFNAITIDGDTSTNDACMLTATGRSGISLLKLSAAQRDEFLASLHGVMLDLSKAIVADAEGGSGRLARIEVCGARNEEEANRVAQTVAQSLLVKTALHGGDANWGRILAAAGRAGVAIDSQKISLHLGRHCVYKDGQPADGYREEQGAAVFSSPEALVRIALGQGAASAYVWTTGLSADYVRINADYRS